MRKNIKSIGIILALVICVGVTACSNSAKTGTPDESAGCYEAI